MNATATIAAAIGLRPQRGAATGWSTEPLAWSAPNLTGQVAFKAQRAEFAPRLDDAAIARRGAFRPLPAWVRGCHRRVGARPVRRPARLCQRRGWRVGERADRAARRRRRRDVRRRRRARDPRPAVGTGRARRRRPQPFSVHRLAGRVRRHHARTRPDRRAQSRRVRRRQPGGRARYPDRRRPHPAVRHRRARHRPSAGPGRHRWRSHQCRPCALRRVRHADAGRGSQGHRRRQPDRRGARCLGHADR